MLFSLCPAQFMIDIPVATGSILAPHPRSHRAPCHESAPEKDHMLNQDLKRAVVTFYGHVLLRIAKLCGYGATVILVQGSDPQETGILSSLTDRYYANSLTFALRHRPEESLS